MLAHPLLGFTPPSPELIGIALLAGLGVLAATQSDLERLGRWSLLGGWFVFALTSPTAQFPTMLRPLGVLVATFGAVLLRTIRLPDPSTDRQRVPLTTKLLFVYVMFVFLGCLASPLGPKNVVRWVQGVMIIATVFYGVSFKLGRGLLGTTFVAGALNVFLTVANGGSETALDGTPTGRLAGFMQPNHLAFTAAIVLLGVIWLFSEKPAWRLPLAGVGLVSFYALYASHSRTALVAFIIAAGYGLAATYLGPGKWGRAAVWGLALTLLLAPLVVPTFGTWFNRDGSEESITSLTGRTDFWPLAVDLINQRPVVGWGINVIQSPAGIEFQKVLPGVGQAHNAYLEAALMGGYPGAIAWALSLLGVLFGAIRLPRRHEYRFLLISSAFLLQIFAFTESSPAWFGDMFIVYVLAAAIYSQAIAAPGTPEDGSADDDSIDDDLTDDAGVARAHTGSDIGFMAGARP